MKPIPYGRQDIGQADIDAVVEVLRSDWLTQGPAIERFEREMAAWCGAKYAVAVSNATAALHLTCLALDLGPGKRLWTSPNTFVASANCGRYVGADVDFVDIDPRTYNMSVEALEQKLVAAERENRLPHVVVPVHFAGQPCEMDAIAALGKRFGFRILEDASHAVGAEYRDTRTGNCVYSDAAVFSFHPVKIITTGEGGMVLTNREDLYEHVKRLRTHGISRDPNDFDGDPDGPWDYRQVELGFNYRITDMQAALGAAQLQRLAGYIDRRHELARRYDEALAGLPLVLPYQSPESRSSLHLYPIQVDEAKAGKTRRQVFEALRERGILVNVHYIPVHTQPYYRALGFRAGDYPVAEAYYGRAISLPMFPTLGEDEQDRVVEALCEILA